MIAVDTNILVYAHREDSSFHDIAFQCVMELAEGPANWQFRGRAYTNSSRL
jgi:uncharacterized protein